MKNAFSLTIFVFLIALGCSKNQEDPQTPKQSNVAPDTGSVREDVQKLPELQGIRVGVVGVVEFGNQRATVFRPR